MSKQIGPVGLDGRVGNISFFYRNGVASARLKSRGLSKERILNDPSLQRVRENMAEFSGTVTMAGAITAAFATVKTLADGTLRNRLMRLLTKVKKRSGGVRGKRALTLSQFKGVLKNFELNAGAPFNSVLKAGAAGIVSTPAAARNSAIAQLTITNPGKEIAAPPEATHVQITHLLGVIPDVAFNDEENVYALLAPELAGVQATSTSSPFHLEAADPISVSLETSIPLETVPDHTTVVEALGIECFQEIDGALYALKEGRCMKIINVF